MYPIVSPGLLTHATEVLMPIPPRAKTVPKNQARYLYPKPRWDRVRTMRVKSLVRKMELRENSNENDIRSGGRGITVWTVLSVAIDHASGWCRRSRRHYCL